VRGNQGKIVVAQNLEPTLEDVFLHITGREVRDQANGKIKMEAQGRGPHGGGRSRGRVR
jgi:hypothetical protein